MSQRRFNGSVELYPAHVYWGGTYLLAVELERRRVLNRRAWPSRCANSGNAAVSRAFQAPAADAVALNLIVACKPAAAPMRRALLGIRWRVSCIGLTVPAERAAAGADRDKGSAGRVVSLYRYLPQKTFGSPPGGMRQWPPLMRTSVTFPFL